LDIDATQFKREQKIILGKDLPFAAALAMTTLVKELKILAQKEIEGRYDRPTRWTKNSLFIEPARKKDYPDLTAAVYFKDEIANGVPAGRYLYPTIAGIKRKHTGFEKALIRNGLMRSNEFAIPAKTARLNQYGNISIGLMRKLLSQLQAAERGGGYQANETVRSRERKRSKKTGRLTGASFFIPKKGSNLPRGIYQRTGRGKPKMVYVFVRTGAPDYSKMFDFENILSDASYQMSDKIWDQAFWRVVEGNRKKRVGRR